MKITDIQKAAWVKRWGIVRTLREQNIAEHSFMVAMISEELCRRIGWGFDEKGALHSSWGFEVLRWALWHDMAEVFTGDIPTPLKSRIKDLDPELLQRIEDELAPTVAEIRRQTNKLWIDVVKVADYLEAITFLTREAANEEAVAVGKLLTKQMMEYVSRSDSMLRRHEKEIVELAKEMGVDIDGY